MDLKGSVKKYVNDGYNFNDARNKVSQDIILLKIYKSNLKKHITIKGGVVMHNISNSVRRVTRDIDLDFIKYSLDEESIRNFVNKLNSVDDDIVIKIVGNIIELSHQDYKGMRVYIEIIDDKNYSIKTKLDIGVHKLFDLKQDDYYFDFGAFNEGVSLLVNSCEQIFVEKLKSLLKMGIRSTRYKDIFDLCYLIDSNKLDKNKLLKDIKLLIFDDNKMFENSIEDIFFRLKSIFEEEIYINKLNNPSFNWLDLSVDKVLGKVLKFIKSFEKEINYV